MADMSSHATTLTLADLTLFVRHLDGVHGQVICEAWTGRNTARVAPLLAIMQQRGCTHCVIDGHEAGRLSFAGYIIGYECQEEAPALLRHTITLAMDGPLWREDDTPVAHFNALDGMDWPTTIRIGRANGVGD